MKLLLFILCFTICARASGNPSDGCLDRIKSIVCLVDPPAHEADRYKDGRPCLPLSAHYADKILAASISYPPAVQEKFCDLKKIYIEKSFFGAAWSALADDHDPHSGLIGLRQKELDDNLRLAASRSQFEQQSFGGSVVTSSSELPTFVVRHSKFKNGTAFTLLHELGHIFDYQNKFNDESCGKACTPKADSWTAISWTTNQTPKLDADFPLRKSICLNNCSGHFIASKDAKALYDGIFQHGFISQLAATNAMEDFAESFAMYVVSEQKMRFEIRLPDGSRYDIDKIIHSPVFAEKSRFLRSHLAPMTEEPRLK